MGYEFDFGKCLSDLLFVRDWSATKLAKEINIDPSYVRKWIRGERVPSVKSPYVDQISECLCLGLEAPCKKQYKDAILFALKEMGFQSDQSSSLCSLIKEALSKAQLFSLKLSVQERITRNKDSDDDVLELLNRMNPEYKLIKRNGNNHDNELDYETLPTVIIGREKILLAFISLIRSARKHLKNSPGRILMTFQGAKNQFDGFHELYGKWHHELIEALKEGWDIEHLMRLDKNLGRSFNIVERMIELLGHKGRYIPLYFNRYGTVNSSNELLIIPGVGALMCFSTSNRDYIDAAFFFNTRETTSILTSHFNQLSLDAEPLIKLFSPSDFYKTTMQNDQKQGDRFCIRNDLDSLTIPFSLWLKLLYQNENINYEETTIQSTRIKNRLDSFYEQLKRYKFKHILPLSSIEYLTTNGKYLTESFHLSPGKEDIIEHLSHIINLLKKYDNFEIALLNEGQINLLTPVFWAVKGDFSVLIDIDVSSGKNNSSNKDNLFFTITEGTISEAFKDYFLEIWDRILPKYRDKSFLISYLEDQISWLDNIY